MTLRLKPLEDRLAPATLSGSVFADYLGDGSRDAIDRGLSGITVRLDLNANGTFDFSTTTKSDGSFSFANVVSGAHSITVVPPSNSTAIALGTKPVTVASADITSLNFAFKPDGKVHGTVFNDTDFDGAVDTGEAGLQNASLVLDLFGDGKSVLTVMAASDGSFDFSGVPNGTHKLTATRANFDHTAANPISVNVVNGVDVAVNLGFAPEAIVSGFVFSDVNGNGGIDGAERLLPNVTVHLDLGNNGTVDRSVLTNANGQYFFSDVPNGSHKLLLDTQSSLVTVTGGTGVSGVGFGIASTGRLDGIAFHDLNANGVKDAGEHGLANAKVSVDFYGNSTIDRFVFTGSDGKYSFTDIPDGSHVVASGLSDYSNTTPQTLAMSYSNGLPNIPATSVVTGPRKPGDPVGSGVLFPNTFGFAKSSVVTGFVYLDANGNGKADTAEAELSGVTVKLDNSVTAITDTYGRYAFTGVASGSHTITVTLPAGYQGTALGKTITVADADMSGLGFALTVADPVQVVAIGASNGGVSILNADGSIKSSFTPFASGGDVRVATGDVNGDKIDDYAVATGAGALTTVRVLNGATGTELFALNPYGSQFYGGAFVALGDLTGDGRADLVITPDITGGPRVRIFSGAGFTQVADFFGIDDVDFRGGARAAVGDLNGDLRGDLAISAGFGGGPRIALFDGMNLTTTGGPKFIGDFFAFEPDLRNGAFLAVGDLNGDGFGDLVAGAGSGGAPRITAFSGKDLINNTQTRLADFFAGGQIGDRSGARVAVSEGHIIASYRTQPTFSSRVAKYSGVNPTTPVFDVEPFPGFLGSIYVG